MTKDRKQYFRDYQRERYKRKRAELQAQAPTVEAPSAKAQLKELYQAEDILAPKHWRRRQMVALEFYRNFGDAHQKFLWRRAKGSAKARGLEFTITVADIQLPSVCPILGVPLEYGPKTDENRRYGPSLDRIDNTKGYVPGNVHVISVRANILKRDATLKELKALGAWAAKQ